MYITYVQIIRCFLVVQNSYGNCLCDYSTLSANGLYLTPLGGVSISGINGKGPLFATKRSSNNMVLVFIRGYLFPQAGQLLNFTKLHGTLTHTHTNYH